MSRIQSETSPPAKKSSGNAGEPARAPSSNQVPAPCSAAGDERIIGFDHDGPVNLEAASAETEAMATYDPFIPQNQ